MGARHNGTCNYQPVIDSMMFVTKLQPEGHKDWKEFPGRRTGVAVKIEKAIDRHCGADLKNQNFDITDVVGVETNHS